MSVELVSLWRIRNTGNLGENSLNEKSGKSDSRPEVILLIETLP